MFRKFSEWAIAQSMKLGYVFEEDSEEYTYGFDLILSVIFSDIAMLIIGLIMHMVWQAIIFTLLYKCMRKYTGGFHCERALTCLISSSIMCMCVLFAIKYAPYNYIIYMTVITICSTLLFYWSPIEAINKPLDAIEVKVFGKRARIVICAIYIIFIVLIVMNLTDIIKVVAISIADVTFFAALGKMKLKIHR